MTLQKQKRVVITGLGVVVLNGIGKEDFWQASISGRSGVRRITRFDANFLPTPTALIRGRGPGGANVVLAIKRV